MDGRIKNVEATLNLDDKDFKKTLKLTWLAVESDKNKLVPCIVNYYDHIISKPVLGKDEDFKDYIGHETKVSFLFNVILYEANSE